MKEAVWSIGKGAGLEIRRSRVQLLGRVGIFKDVIFKLNYFLYILMLGTTSRLVL